MYTKQNFEEFADLLAKNAPEGEHISCGSLYMKILLDIVMMFEKSNPKFNRETFIKESIKRMSKTQAEYLKECT